MPHTLIDIAYKVHLSIELGKVFGIRVDNTSICEYFKFIMVYHQIVSKSIFLLSSYYFRVLSRRVIAGIMSDSVEKGALIAYERGISNFNCGG